jgi:pilus assembly protein Flp/PilA
MLQYSRIERCSDELHQPEAPATTANSGGILVNALTYAYLYMRQVILDREEGQDLAEYALLIALIAIVVIVAVTALGGQVKTIFQNIATELGASPAS